MLRSYRVLHEGCPAWHVWLIGALFVTRVPQIVDVRVRYHHWTRHYFYRLGNRDPYGWRHVRVFQLLTWSEDAARLLHTRWAGLLTRLLGVERGELGRATLRDQVLA